jgi:hypothetical protein
MLRRLPRRDTITVDDAAFRERLKAQLPTDFRQPQPRGQVRVAPEASLQPHHP